MKRLTLIALAALAAACGGSGSMADRSRDALPSKDSVQVGTPSSKSSTIRGDHSVDEQNSSVGDGSFWAATTITLAFQVNTGVIWSLGLVEAITNLPPTSCTATSCTWGPGSGAADPVNYKLVVNYEASTDSYVWALSGEAKANAGTGFVAIIEGTAHPSGIPHHGSGHFSIDFDAAKTLNPSNTDIGKLEIDYDNATLGSANLSVSFLGVKDNDHPGQKTNALYSFQDTVGGGGDLDVAWHNTTSNDRMALHSRWKATGAGRADVNVSIAGAGSSAYQASASECWSALTGKVVFFHTDDNAHLGANAGVETDCSFSPASFSAKSAP